MPPFLRVLCKGLSLSGQFRAHLATALNLCPILSLLVGPKFQLSSWCAVPNPSFTPPTHSTCSPRIGQSELGGNSIHMFPFLSTERIQPLFKQGGNSQEEPCEASFWPCSTSLGNSKWRALPRANLKHSFGFVSMSASHVSTQNCPQDWGCKHCSRSLLGEELVTASTSTGPALMGVQESVYSWLFYTLAFQS